MRTWQFPSKSEAGKVYTVTHADNGLLGCDCRGWLMKKPGRPRQCSHLTDVIASAGLVPEVRGDYVFAEESAAESSLSHQIPLTPSENGSIITESGDSDKETTMATVMTTTGQQLEAMKACAMVAGKFGHVLDADGFIVPEKFDAVFGGGEWTQDEKLDGHRCLITKADGVISTTLRSIPSLPSQILTALAAMPDGVYDGELLVPGGVSTDVPNLALRNELIFAMFDLLEIAGQSVMHLPLADRRELLLVAADFAPGSAVVVVAQADPTWAGVLAIWANGGEGVILKKKSSPYRPGARSADWLKVKRLEQHTVTVTGFENGSYGPTAVVLFQFDDGTTGRCKNKNNELLAATAANPGAYIGRRLVVQCQQRMRGSKSPRHPMMVEFEADHEAGEAE